MATCAQDLATIASYTGSTVSKLGDVIINSVNIQNRINEMKDRQDNTNTYLEALNTKTDRTNELLEMLVISIKGGL